MHLFATCARGLEPFLAQELTQLGGEPVRAGRGGVYFEGDRALLYRANLQLRTAVRVLEPILESPVTSTDDLYDAVRSLDWTRYLTPEHTLAVDANVRDSRITHSHFAALRVKDAICDQFVDKVGVRPSVDVDMPLVGLNLHIYRDEMVLSLDSSGKSLHKRGYRPIQPKAPLNEALAAALILSTGWRGDAPFADPLCGSGTLCIEAAWLALSRPPGLTRRRFGFMGWMDYDVHLWTSLRDEARSQVKNKLAHPILGTDNRRDSIAYSRQNAKAAGVGHLLAFDLRDVRDWTPPPGEPGVIICNPPYGERLGEEKELIGLYRTMGEVFRSQGAGWRAFVFTGNPRLAEEAGLEPVKNMNLFNGRIPCRVYST